MDNYTILLVQPRESCELGRYIQDQFSVTRVESYEECLHKVQNNEFNAILLDHMWQAELDLAACNTFIEQYPEDNRIPIILLAGDDHVDIQLKAIEAGCDDVISQRADHEEVVIRITKSIYNGIANQQLKSLLDNANKTAFTAMADNSDLGSNIQFLLEVNRCDNLDELGQLLFRSLNHYGLKCSMQMRSAFGVKNMEPSGLAKELESELLFKLKDDGRYIDFGCRTVVNYGQASLLIRNMPIENSIKYGAIKDNTFALIQGVDSRIKGLDQQFRLEEEKQSLKRLSKEIKNVMVNIDASYKEVMSDIVNIVEDMSEAVGDKIPSLALSLEQEQFFEDITMNCTLKTNETFNKGMRVDTVFQKLSDQVDSVLYKMDQRDIEAEEEKGKLGESFVTDDNGGVDLF